MLIVYQEVISVICQIMIELNSILLTYHQITIRCLRVIYFVR